jgi:prepilin-type N-terminal cleavage/methylation domain-containing protein
MNEKKYIQDEKGYTLIETIVAMVLFLSVLIPLIATMGNVMLDHKAKLTSSALALAVTEMNSIADSRDFTEAIKTMEGGLIVQRKVQMSVPLMEVEVSVRTAGELPKEIVTLKRVFLVYQ